MRLTETIQPLHPPCEPFSSEVLDVAAGHRLYIEQCGNPTGMPLLFLHGGPGSGCSTRHRQFFDPRLCRTILFDQRGCGRSLPHGVLQHNHTDALLQDIDTLRRHLGIARWLVVGGSWGAGLALAYASAYPQDCLGLVLRGVFLGRDSDIDWFFRGAAHLLPDAWQQLSQQAPGPVDGDLLQGLHAGLHGPDDDLALACALTWEAWEQSVLQRSCVAPRALAGHYTEASTLINKYRVQSHYLHHQCFRGGYGLLPRASNLSGIPTALLHGRLDWICRPQAAWDVHCQLPDSRLQWIDDCGHNPFETANASALMTAIQHFVTFGDFSRWGTRHDHAQCSS
jgi:proline iminopeptidase